MNDMFDTMFEDSTSSLDNISLETSKSLSNLVRKMRGIKGEDNLAGDVIGMLEDRGFHPNTKTHIHPQTLKAFLREQLSQGTNMDLDMFGAYVLSTAEIKRK